MGLSSHGGHKRPVKQYTGCRLRTLPCTQFGKVRKTMFSLLFTFSFLFHLDVCTSLTPDLIREMSGLPSSTEQLLSLEASNGGYPADLFPNVSKSCLNALRELTKAPSPGSELIKYIDATGKLQSGISKGNVAWLGSYDLCQNITDAHYCLADVHVVASNRTIPASWGLCIPNACSEMDIAFGLSDTISDVLKLVPSFLKRIIHIEITVSTEQGGKNHAVHCAHPSKWTTGPIVTLVVCAVLALLCLAGTLLEMLVVDESWRFWLQPLRAPKPYRNGVFVAAHDSDLLHSDGEVAPLLSNSASLDTSSNHLASSIQFQKHGNVGRGFLINFLLCFSLIRNTNKIMNTAVPPGAITSLNGVRVLSMWWVILGHTFLWMLVDRVFNDVVLGLGIVHRFSFQSVNSAFFAVDSFFLLSGVLVAYLSFRRMEKNSGELPLFQFYFHRFWRLTPSYMFVILVFTNLTGFLGDGPRWYINQQPTTCGQYWWTNLLYINNFHPNQLVRECLGWSWYLANDMQFYVVSPLLLFVIFRFGWKGVAAGVGGLLAVSFLVTGVIIGVYNTNVLLAENIEAGFAADPNRGSYSDLVYIKPYCRIAPYLVGIALGYLFYQEKCLPGKSSLFKLPRQIVSVTGWFVAMILALSSVYGIYGAYRKGGRPFDFTENLLYGTFSRFLWGLSVAWVIYACNSGYGSLVNKFLSARFWIPLSRLTYSAYLLHPIVLPVFFGSFRNTVEYTDKLFAFYFVSVVVMSYASAFVLAVFVEFPTMQLEGVLFFRQKRENVRTMP